jgi:hypothetical protein
MQLITAALDASEAIPYVIEGPELGFIEFEQIVQPP